MITRITDDFDPERIAQSGQCFRWEKKEGGTWRIIAGKQKKSIKRNGAAQ